MAQCGVGNKAREREGRRWRKLVVGKEFAEMDENQRLRKRRHSGSSL